MSFTGSEMKAFSAFPDYNKRQTLDELLRRLFKVPCISAKQVVPADNFSTERTRDLLLSGYNAAIV